MIGRHYIYGIDYVSGPFSEVVDFIEEAHNDKSAVLIGFAPMTSAANAVRNKEYRNILNSFDIVCMDGASIVRKVKDARFGEQSVVAVRTLCRKLCSVRLTRTLDISYMAPISWFWKNCAIS